MPTKQMIRSHALLMLSCLMLNGCKSKNRPELYDFDPGFGSRDPVVRVTCYRVPSRIWRSEVELSSTKTASKTLVGADAKRVWDALTHQQEHVASLTNYSFTNEDYQVVAEDATGKLSSVIIGQTFVRSDGRYLGCFNLSHDWIADLMKKDVKRLGIE